jgi:hypothetical protein
MAYHEAYRELWIAAGYPGDMGSACAVKPPPKEYCAAYHFTETEHAIGDIENACIKVTRISEANDPFEFQGLNVNDTRIAPVIRRFKIENDEKLRILCFSKDWRSPALWAHYARNHAGICLGFWVKRETLQEVTYHANRIDAGFSKSGPIVLTPEIIEQLMTAKADDWSYEQEIRRFLTLSETFETQGKRFFQFDDTLRLSEVILGEKCTKKLGDVRDFVGKKYKDVTVFGARSAFGYFKMVPDEKTVPP